MNMFYLDSINKEYCCGCQACMQICPTHCITMREDEHGFLYPHRDQQACMECGLCRSVCPFVFADNVKTDSKNISRAFFAKHNDDQMLYQSASGGVFSAVAQAFCDEDFVIFGARFDSEWKVIHDYVDSLDSAQVFRKSKYVQSDINGAYRKAEGLLKQGKIVLFTGTPCQIAALRLFLQNDYERLLCVDLVCHGVPSQKMFDNYLEFLREKFKSNISDFGFRHKVKKRSGKWQSRNVRYVTNGREIITNANQDPYLRAYHNALNYRLSCYQCPFASPDRISDITMADFWGLEKLFPNEDMHKGVSVVLANTAKGMSIVKRLDDQMTIEEVDVNYVVMSNGQLNHPANKHPKYDDFFRRIQNRSFDKAVNQTIPRPTVIRKIASKIMPRQFKNVIRRAIQRMKGEVS